MNSFIYITNELTHIPWSVDETGMPSPERAWVDTRDLENSGLSEAHLRTEYFALKKLIAWFNWMKENHVYDNTQIVVVSDHSTCDSADIVNLWGRLPLVCAHGLLLVKEYGARGELVIDRATQMANWDVPVLIENGLLRAESEKKFPWKDGARVRMHVSGPTKTSELDKKTYEVTNIVKIQGPLYRKDSWTRIKGWWPPEN